MRTPLLSILTLALILGNTDAYAWPPTFGAEFTFTNTDLWVANFGKKNLVRTDANQAARDEMTRIMELRCKERKDCSISFSTDKYGSKVARVTYKDQWWFQISVDPAVVEIQTKPSTQEQLAAFRERIQNDIFGAAAEAKVLPDAGSGGGHIHIGTESAIGKDAKTFRNFIVDYANHPELGMGILEDDLMNNPPLASLTEKQRAQFKAVIDRFDRGEIKKVRALAKELEEKVYFDNPHSKVSPPRKYQAMNVMRTSDSWASSADRTIEMRAIRAQRSVDDFLLETKLFQARLEKLRSTEGLIPVNLPDAGRNSPQQLVDGFHAYVTEAGLDWDEYKGLMPDHLQTVQPSTSAPKRLVFSLGAERKPSCLGRLLEFLF